MIIAHASLLGRRIKASCCFSFESTPQYREYIGTAEPRIFFVHTLLSGLEVVFGRSLPFVKNLIGGSPFARAISLPCPSFDIRLFCKQLVFDPLV
jgi:aminoglycoside N3'-acetyltransferase